MTIKQAKEQGYQMCSNEDGSACFPLDSITEDYIKSNVVFLSSKDSFTYSIDQETIKELFVDHVNNQDEVNNEDGGLDICLDDVPWDIVAFIVNKHFDRRYYSVTGIQLEVEESYNSNNFV